MCDSNQTSEEERFSNYIQQIITEIPGLIDKAVRNSLLLVRNQQLRDITLESFGFHTLKSQLRVETRDLADPA